ncbi:sulfotransferase [Stieleria sp. TO1_6]|uniref:sulfotransferase family protein n=1 Tax=Stieleria tagensis TaxID=2956795 RepID=UPI00209AA497|nr:sulfotransferase [Stieleria tagensis]MCO8120674.1 sulfotransferase [Stieleria tagensis]
MSSPQPFFVVGSVRSGTTLLRLMLDHHPQICCFGEFEYSIDLLNEPDQWPTGQRYAEWLADERRFQSNRLSADPNSDYQTIAKGMFTEMTGRCGKQLVAAGASVHRHFDRLQRLWPNAKYVYLYRDGRDVARSCMAMGWAGNVWAGARYWEEAEDTWAKLKGTIPADRWIEVRNEDLVTDTEHQLDRICQLVGTDFDPAMLTYPETTTYSLPDRSLLEQWRRKLSRRELQQLETRIGDRLKERGYADSDVPPKPIGPLTTAQLKLQNTIGKHQFRIHRFGMRLWAQELAARKLGLRSLERSAKRQTRQIAIKHLK